MSVLADISTGNTATADVFFLIAAIVFAIAAIAYLVPVRPGVPPDRPGRSYAPWSGFLVALGLCLVAIAWLVL